jgi:hypothetical protein
LIEVLLLHRRCEPEAVLAGIRAALTVGSVSADVVAIEARKHTAATPADATPEPPVSPVPGPRRSRAAVIPLDARRQAASSTSTGLPDDQRPAPSVRDYDQLLTHRGEQAASS